MTYETAPYSILPPNILPLEGTHAHTHILLDTHSQTLLQVVNALKRDIEKAKNPTRRDIDKAKEKHYKIEQAARDYAVYGGGDVEDEAR